MDQRTNQALRGRGAVSNRAGRHESATSAPFDDGWGSLDEPGSLPKTIVTHDLSRSILSTNDSPDVPFSQSVNPYRGCEHGCIYCYARPSHAWLGYSPGLDFETRILAKPAAAELLREAFMRPKYRPQGLALGANTDPYQPVERELGISRALLEVLLEFRHPVTLITKSAGVLRDLDLLGELAAQGLARVLISVTTLDPKLSRSMEPRASAPARRLQAIAGLAEAGVPVGVLASPMIPALNDSELEAVLEAARDAGAETAGTILLRLPMEVAELFEEWLRAHHPDRAERVLSLVRQTRGGGLNQAAFGQRMRGSGPYAELLRRRFHVAVGRLGLDREWPPPDLSLFRRTAVPRAQLSLFSDAV